MNEMKTKNVTATAKQRFQTVTPTKGSTNTANATVTAPTASKTAPNTWVNMPRAESTAKARFGTQMARVMRVAGWKTAETATEFTTT